MKAEVTIRPLGEQDKHGRPVFTGEGWLQWCKHKRAFSLCDEDGDFYLDEEFKSHDFSEEFVFVLEGAQEANRWLLGEKSRLEAKIRALETDLEFYKKQACQVAKIRVPDRVIKWVEQYDQPFDMFKCHEHNEWFTDLDACFPYSAAGCVCPKCGEA